VLGYIRITESYKTMASLNLPWERREFALSRSGSGSEDPAPEAATPPNKRDDAVLATRRKGARRTNIADGEGYDKQMSVWRDERR